MAELHESERQQAQEEPEQAEVEAPKFAAARELRRSVSGAWRLQLPSKTDPADDEKDGNDAEDDDGEQADEDEEQEEEEETENEDKVTEAKTEPVDPTVPRFTRSPSGAWVLQPATETAESNWKKYPDGAAKEKTSTKGKGDKPTCGIARGTHRPPPPA